MGAAGDARAGNGAENRGVDLRRSLGVKVGNKRAEQAQINGAGNLQIDLAVAGETRDAVDVEVGFGALEVGLRDAHFVAAIFQLHRS